VADKSHVEAVLLLLESVDYSSSFAGYTAEGHAVVLDQTDPLLVENVDIDGPEAEELTLEKCLEEEFLALKLLLDLTAGVVVPLLPTMEGCCSVSAKSHSNLNSSTTLLCCLEVMMTRMM
jgi:hypothetical protein